MTLQGALEDLIKTFQGAGFEQPQFEARQLVQECLRITFAQLVSEPDRQLDPGVWAQLEAWKTQRTQGVPLAYLSGRKNFYKYEFHVEPGVLVPRPETELVVETALRRIEDLSRPVFTLADLGCGSGCIGLSLIGELTELRLWAVDGSPAACDATFRNAAELGLSERVKVENKKVPGWEPGLNFDLIVANPPYIAENDPHVEPGVRRHEPAEALFAGEDGLERLREWSEWSYNHMMKGGLLVFEFGAGQSRPVEDMIAKQGFDRIQIERDYAGHERVISAVKTR